MSDLTPLEAAEIIEDIAAVSDLKAVDGKRSGVVKIGRVDAEDLRIAASYLRTIAAGEYKQVVHATWIESNQNNNYSCRLIKCSNCGEAHIVPYTISLDEWAENRNYCGNCGALMHKSDMGILQDGKD
jgi:NADH pyrophosphatase NudC (nudix superfamily)